MWVYFYPSNTETELQNAYIGEYKERTFTITRTEKSDMSSWWTYSDDAAWLTAGSADFDEFFWYYGCRLNSSWEETSKITQTQSWGDGKLDITQLWTLTSWDNVMIAFPVRWIKMTKNWSTVTLSITEWLNKTWYQYYAFTRYGTIKDKLYLWAYKWYNSSNVLKSWSWYTASTNISLVNACTYAKSNNSSYNSANSNYEEVTWYARQYVNALYMMKYWNPNAQSVVWNWYTSQSAQTTWATNSITDATGTTNKTSRNSRVKLFWLEDRWGTVWEWVDGAYYSASNRLKTSITWKFNSSWHIATSNFDSTTMVITSWTIKAIIWDNQWMFAISESTGSSWDASYYSDYTGSASSWKYIYVGWAWDYSVAQWVFSTQYNWDTAANQYMSTRIMYL